MTYMKIYCSECGGTWEIYHRDNWKDDRARQCPHCFSEIDRHTWDKEILPAFAAVNDANAELRKSNNPRFAFDVIADQTKTN